MAVIDALFSVLSESWAPILAIIFGAVFVDLMVASEDFSTPLFIYVLKWLLVPLWGPVVLVLWYLNRRRKNAEIQAWLKAELSWRADEQNLAYQQGMIENDWLLVRAGTYGEYDDMLVLT